MYNVNEINNKDLRAASDNVVLLSLVLTLNIYSALIYY